VRTDLSLRCIKKILYSDQFDFKQMNLLILTSNLSDIELFLHQSIWQDSIRG